jgi:hypothetical protein
MYLILQQASISSTLVGRFGCLALCQIFLKHFTSLQARSKAKKDIYIAVFLPKKNRCP